MLETSECLDGLVANWVAYRVVQPAKQFRVGFEQTPVSRYRHDGLRLVSHAAPDCLTCTLEPELTIVLGIVRALVVAGAVSAAPRLPRIERDACLGVSAVNSGRMLRELNR